MSNRNLLRNTSLRAYADGADWKSFRAVVSLHAHTHHSREVLGDLPPYIARIPLLGRRFTRELDERRSRHEIIDFSKGWWHPPVSPRAVFESETAQIDQRFELDSLVSVTDHDDISAGLELQRLFAIRRAPISFEWTVPHHEGFFHLGLHDLPPTGATEWFERLSSWSPRSRKEPLADVLHALHDAHVLIVFNHPLWDLAGIGMRTHVLRLREFLDAHQSCIHALEINGYRSRQENSEVRCLSHTRHLPLISGGDRHARAPNAVLNLTRARTFSEFAAEVRDGVSHVVVMPEYDEHLAARIAVSASDVLASYRVRPSGWQRWTDRVSVESEGTVRPLSDHWPEGGPLWVRSSIAAFQFFMSAPLIRVWRAALRRRERPAPISAIPMLS